MEETDVLIIGSGIAGGITALALAMKGIQVTMISSESALESNSYAAQGGIIFEGKNDNFSLLSQDILRAGAGLCNPPAVEFLAKEGPYLVKKILIDCLKVPFDKTEANGLYLTREAAHSLPRLLCCKDHTGKAIMDSLFQKIRENKNITYHPHRTAVDLITMSHHSANPVDIYEPLTCLGSYILNTDTGEIDAVVAKETVLATGGVGEVFLHSTNPMGARGDGIAMAYRAGVRIMNMEYVQFHPTSLFVPNERRFLLTEALRGEGARLISVSGEHFMSKHHPEGDLAPRDVVARGIYMEMLAHNSDYVYLDITRQSKDKLMKRFPTVYQHCLSRGYDMAKDPVPVVPAAHYLCGGISVDLQGQSSMRRLRAVGEVACTGVHGANRLASASLLEGLVWGKSCADDIAGKINGYAKTYPPIHVWRMGKETVDSALIQQDWQSIKQTMWNYVGLVRDQRRLYRARNMLRGLKWEIKVFYESARLTAELLALRNGVQTALIITQGAMRNRFSRGCHYLTKELDLDD